MFIYQMCKNVKIFKNVILNLHEIKGQCTNASLIVSYKQSFLDDTSSNFS